VDHNNSFRNLRIISTLPTQSSSYFITVDTFDVEFVIIKKGEIEMKSSGSRSSEPSLAQARKSRLFEKLRFGTLSQARILQCLQLFLAQASQISLKQESFSIAQYSTPPDSVPYKDSVNTHWFQEELGGGNGSGTSLGDCFRLINLILGSGDMTNLSNFQLDPLTSFFLTMIDNNLYSNNILIYFGNQKLP
ncbi:hypothetical protein Lal_00018741, partial [Lupinus albus]